MKPNYASNFKHSIAKKFIFYILLFSSIVTLLLTSLQLYLDYHRDLQQIEQRVVQVEKSYLQSIKNTLWVSDLELLQTQLEGISQLPDIEYIDITLDQQLILAVGHQLAKETQQRLFALTYRYRGKSVDLGTLRIVISLDDVYQRLIDKAMVILVTQSLKTFLVSIFIFIIFYLLVGRHLHAIAAYGHSLSLNAPTQPIDLSRARQDVNERDELSQLQVAINQMRSNLYQSYAELKLSNDQLKHEVEKHKAAEQKIVSLNAHLEETVVQRTAKLEQTNIELEQSLQTVHQAQQQLLRQEKMACLGGLVSGVAHELNTPLGIGITAISSLQEKNSDLRKKLQDNLLSKAALLEYIQNSDDAIDMIFINLNNASQLVSSFKQVSTDQENEALRHFDLACYLEEIFRGLKPLMSKTKHQYTLQIDSAIQMNTYPGVFSQIIINLVLNSLTHGFDLLQKGKIHIQASQRSEQLVLVYSDNGRGIDPSVQSKIFDPFVTTKRGQGGTGLGLHIIYNIVTLKLGGEINCCSVSGEGATFTLKIPVNSIEI